MPIICEHLTIVWLQIGHGEWRHVQSIAEEVFRDETSPIEMMKSADLPFPEPADFIILGQRRR